MFVVFGPVRGADAAVDDVIFGLDLGAGVAVDPVCGFRSGSGGGRPGGEFAGLAARGVGPCGGACDRVPGAGSVGAGWCPGLFGARTCDFVVDCSFGRGGGCACGCVVLEFDGCGVECFDLGVLVVGFPASVCCGGRTCSAGCGGVRVGRLGCGQWGRASAP